MQKIGHAGIWKAVYLILSLLRYEVIGKSHSLIASWHAEHSTKELLGASLQQKKRRYVVRAPRKD